MPRSKPRFMRVEGQSQVLRSNFQAGTWVDLYYPYAILKRARVLTADSRRLVTNAIGKEVEMGVYNARVRAGTNTEVPGRIGIRTLDGRWTANPDEGIVMFLASPNSVHASMFGPGWYDERHGPHEPRQRRSTQPPSER